MPKAEWAIHKGMQMHRESETQDNGNNNNNDNASNSNNTNNEQGVTDQTTEAAAGWTGLQVKRQAKRGAGCCQMSKAVNHSLAQKKKNFKFD